MTDQRSAASGQDPPRHYVELFERVDAVKGGGMYRWLVYDSASKGERRFGWFADEDAARELLAKLEARDAAF